MNLHKCLFAKKSLSFILALTLLFTALPFGFDLTASAETAEEYEALGSYSAIKDSYFTIHSFCGIIRLRETAKKKPEQKRNQRREKNGKVFPC